MQKEKMIRFLGDMDASVLIIKGMAGTGKTTNLKDAIDYLHQQDRPYALVAPTGMAAKNLKSRLEADLYARPQTIHSFLYERAVVKNEGEEEEQLVFSVRDNAELPHNLVVFVDEASMVSHKKQHENYLQFGSGNLLEDLLEYIDLEQSSRQLVFIGDDYQLPPVNVNEAVVLQADELSNYVAKPIEELRLTTVYRQNTNSHLYTILTKMRDGLTAADYRIVPIQADGEELQHIEAEQALEQYLWEYGKNSIYIAYSNEDVHSINQKFRALSEYRPGTLELGERLIITKNCYIDQTRLYNGDFVRVEKLGDKEVKTLRLPVKGGHKEVTLVFQQAVLAYRNELFMPQIIECKLLEHRLWQPKLLTESEEQEERRAIIADFQMRHRHLKPKTEAYYEAFMKDPYVNAIHTRLGYAITCHKAQGGEWDQVYIKLDNPYLNLNSRDGFRWAYTAMSRARKKIYVVGYKEQKPDPVPHLKNTIAALCASNGLVIKSDKDIQYGLQYEIMQEDKLGRLKIYFNKKNKVSSLQCIDQTETTLFLQELLQPIVGKSIHEL